MATRALNALRLAATGMAGLALMVTACSEEGPGEDRPNVEVIGGGGSASISGVVEGYGEALYLPSTDQALNLGVGADLGAMREIMSAAARNQEVNWAAVSAIYFDGQNQVQADGRVRSLSSLAQDDLSDVFVNGAAVFGREQFLDGFIRDALSGEGRAAGLGDNARRQIVDRGVQMIQLGHALNWLNVAQSAMDAGDTDGAAAALDAAWAILAGPRETTMPNDGLLATALAREEDFLLQGRIARPLEAHLFQARVATEQDSAEQFTAAVEVARAHLNTIFYLSTLRDAKVTAGDSRSSDREAHLAEGWAFFQAIRAQVTVASPESAATIEDAFTRDAGEAFPADLTEDVYTALNQDAVLEALEIPAEFRFTSPAQ